MISSTFKFRRGDDDSREAPVYNLVGTLDHLTTREPEAADITDLVQRDVRERAVEKVVLDLAAVEHINSSGADFLLRLGLGDGLDGEPKPIVFRNPSPIVGRLLEACSIIVFLDTSEKPR